MAKTAKRQLGDIGENIACDFLVRRGFDVLARNYLRKWGEIDIIARKGSVMRFIEVKSVSHVTPVVEQSSLRGRPFSTVPQETSYRPEENMHPGKLRRLARTIQIYLLENKLDCDWQLDLVTVKIDEKGRKARVELIENIII